MTMAAAPAGAARLAHLFRAARREGRIHPLQHLIQRYRGEADVDVVLPPWVAPSPSPSSPVASRRSAGPAAHGIDPAELRRRVRELPALPQAALEALAALRDDLASSERCGELIGRDQALAARTLRLANSAFYGVPCRVGTISDAVHLLGRRTLGSLLTLATLLQAVDTSGCPDFSFAAFWRHAIAVALIARGLAGAMGSDEERAFTVGLLHDIGRLTLTTHYPAQMAAALAHPQAHEGGLLAVEQAVLGTDHAEVGALVATQWHFPAAVVAAIAGHHAPSVGATGATPAALAVSSAGGSPASLADIAHVADAVAHALDLAGAGDELVPVLDIAAWERLAPALEPAVLLQIFQDTEDGVAELCRLLGL